MFQPIYDIEGGLGWMISGRTLLPEITDHTLFREVFEQDNLFVPLELLWTGYPEQALRLLDKKPVSTRRQALIADCFRDLERYPEAEQIYRDLLKNVSAPCIEATLHQHLGKILLYAGDYQSALDEFRQSLTLRKSLGVAPEIIASSQQAYDFMKLNTYQMNKSSEFIK
ncbi:tetratricopeptide repeat protein [Rothia amarae]|uniref:Tetratricopeptide repeat protein n=1 Tax=Rothia amarae TaxID=169480 RepID=A0A7H2BLG1_9MICC|nr:tetratricopeptide repeat protein [Rothia amarae]QNV40507.1 tetratricopeptide repeat protein [Rothia amarae]